MVCYATPLIGGPEKTRINRYGDNSPRETRRTIMQSLSIHENFSGFQSTREHNASILPKCLGYGRNHIRCKDTARREKIQIYLQFSEPQRIFILQSKINVVKVSIPSNKYPIKKRHPRGCLYTYKRGACQLTLPTRC